MVPPITLHRMSSKRLGAEVITIGAEPNGLNINDGFGATKPRVLASSVRVNNADLGIALDGDGDRVIMVDGNGEIVDGDELLYIIARSRLDNGGLLGQCRRYPHEQPWPGGGAARARRADSSGLRWVIDTYSNA